MRMMGNNTNNNGHPSSPTSPSSSSSSSSWPMSIIRIIFLLSCIFEIFSIGGYLHNDPHFTSSLSSNENRPLHHHDDTPKPTLNSSNFVVSNTHAATSTAAASISNQRASPEVESPVILQQSASLSSINQRIVDCRLQVEKWINPQIETWLENKKKRPILDWVWIMNNNSQSSYSLIMFHIEHIVKQSTTSNNTRMKYHGSSGGTWICQDNNNKKNHPAIDVNKRNDIEDKIFLKCNTTNPSKIWFIEDEKEAMNVLEYDVSPMLKCSILEQNNPPFPIIRTPPSTSSSPNTNTNQKSSSLVSKTNTATTSRRIKLGACLKFQGGNLSFQSGNRRKVLQWIIYHRLLGVQHFWLLINESEFNLTGLELGADDITYLPYNYNWPGYKNRGANGGGNFFQTTAQNQCLYRAKQYNMEWIFTTDVDEYIWLSPTALLDLDKNSKYPLLDYLELHHEQQQQENGNDDVGALVMNSIPFGRNRQLQSVNETFELVIDYTYRKTRDTPWGVRHHRWKCIYHVPVASKLSVHGLDYPENSMTFLNVSQVHINHYKNPHAGVWQGKKDIYEESSLPDRYRNEMMQSLASITTYP